LATVSSDAGLAKKEPGQEKTRDADAMGGDLWAWQSKRPKTAVPKKHTKGKRRRPQYFPSTTNFSNTHHIPKKIS